MDYFGKIFAGILVVVVIFLEPIQYIFELQNSSLSSYIESIGTDFVDHTCETGEFTVEEYEQLRSEVMSTGTYYEIELKHAHPVTTSEVLETTQKEEDNGSIVSLATHTHTSSCYYNHIHSGSTSGTPSTNHLYTSGCYTYHLNRGVCGYRYSNGILEIPSAATNRTSNNTELFAILNEMKTGGPEVACAFPAILCFETKVNYSNNHTMIYRVKYATGVNSNDEWTFTVSSIRAYQDVYSSEKSVSYYLNSLPSLTIDQLISAMSSPNTFIATYLSTSNTSITGTVTGYSTATCWVETSTYVHCQTYGIYPEDGEWYISCSEAERKYEATESCSGTLVPTGSSSSSTILSSQATNINNMYRVLRQTYTCSSCGQTYTVISLCANDSYARYAYLIEGSVPSHNGSTLANAYVEQTGTLGNTILDIYAKALEDALCMNGIKYVSLFDSAYSSYVGYKKIYVSGYISSVAATVMYYVILNGNYTYTATNDYDGTFTARSCPHYSLTKIEPACSKVVTSLVAKENPQTIRKGESINTVATATFLDGHTEEVTCTTTYTSDTIADNQTATLNYSCFTTIAGVKTSTKGTKSCTVTVNVKALKTLTRISANLTKTTINRTEEFPISNLTLYYSNGESEVVTSGWSLSGFNSTGSGSQNVTISYTYEGITCTQVVAIYVKVLKSISATLSTDTITKYTPFPITSLTLVYNDNSSETVTSGWTLSGFDNLMTGSQTVTISYTCYGVTRTTTATVLVTNLKTICEICGNEYYLSDEDFDLGCPYCNTHLEGIYIAQTTVTVDYGDALELNVYAIYMNGKVVEVSDWTSNYDPTKIGAQIVTVKYEGFQATVNVIVIATKICDVCGTEYELNYDGSDPGCPNCAALVESISADPTSITLSYGEDLTSSKVTVTATYKDGHKQAVKTWTSNYDEYTSGEQIVTIMYCGKSVEITVNVIRKLTTCSICNREYDSTIYPNGCPYCGEEVTAITASLVGGGTQVQLGSDLSLLLIVTFRDGHREMKYSGYTYENYDKTTLGAQTVTVYYESCSCTLDIEVVNTLIKVTCSNGHVYSLNEDGSDPGCPYCTDSTLATAVSYLDVTYTTDILESLYETGTYTIPEGDYFTIVITKKESSYFSSSGLFHMNLLMTNKKFMYGGEVHE